ncbi:Predicted arabinose efflux permease, MFS family [Jatrophihabitans endophyticus]|uniref:Predicted arabinose efflux permease, MFS family n=1 Tax=Jatrophihabitans endophyticus TaxID=1206085 RepID=A0A1M5MYX9_9ACTN|nr:MFS transporter [Jatrophihabitans endophyticus]SHG81963.1 Predicted arabinose efflux permease, MFS family [Jatrophihabitans endophyticus]
MIESYRAVLRHGDVRRVLLLGTIVRVPLWAANVILTLHVVTTLDRSYAAAGLLAAVATVALSVSAPWRGRRLDRDGLRAAVAPSLVVLAGCWSVAPFVGYWPLLVLAAVAGLFEVPSFSIVRQVLLRAVPEGQRTTALSIDSVAVEVSFMIGPALGVVLATYLPTSWALFACQFASVAGGVAIWLADPPLRGTPAPAAPADPAPAAPTGHRPPAVRDWLDLRVGALLVMSAAATMVLTGTDVGVVAALRDMDHQTWIGWELAVWGAGSAVGGLVYGALRRTIPVAALLALLAATALPVALGGEPLLLAALLFVTGFWCAPTVTASVDELTRFVPERVRGEALGWHGSALTLGSGVGAPLAGIAIDHVGWRGGFVLPALLGLLAAAFGWAASRRGVERTATTTARRPLVET